MHPSQITLVVVSTVVNVMLWIEYAVMRPRARDFGAVTGGGMRAYMLTTAAIAYLCNLAYIGLIAAAPPKTLSTAQFDTITGAVAVYYMLQLLFLPLVRSSLQSSTSKVWAQGLLVLCIAPMAVLAIAAVQSKNAALIALSIVPLLHVTVNDAVLYGGLF